MALEIERKFLVAGESWRTGADAGAAVRQGYLSRGESASVRVRIIGEAAFLTIKSAHAGAARSEFEYPIPPADAEQMLAHLCAAPLIEKRRHTIAVGGHIWTVDVFEGALAGLTLAEVELAHADETIAIPPWAGREVTDDPRYRNDALSPDTPR